MKLNEGFPYITDRVLNSGNRESWRKKHATKVQSGIAVVVLLYSVLGYAETYTAQLIEITRSKFIAKNIQRFSHKYIA